MKTIALVMVASLAAVPVQALDVQHGYTISLTDAQMAQCEAEGGCHLISEQAAMKAIEDAARKMAGNCMGGT